MKGSKTLRLWLQTGTISKKCGQEENILSWTEVDKSEPRTGGMWWCNESIKPSHLKRREHAVLKDQLILPKNMWRIEAVQVHDSIVRNNISRQFPNSWLTDGQIEQLDQKPVQHRNRWNAKGLHCWWQERLTKLSKQWSNEVSTYGQCPVLSPFFCSHIFMREMLLFTWHHKRNTEAGWMLSHTWDWCWPWLIQTSQDCVCRIHKM